MMRAGEIYVAGKKTGTALLVKLGGAWMTIGTAIPYLQMVAAAYADGVKLQVNSGWRSNAHQAQLYADYTSGERTAVAARPGYSNHQNGIALDVESANGTNAAFHWLTANAHRFGFKRTVKSEPWHWEHQPDEVQS